MHTLINEALAVHPVNKEFKFSEFNGLFSLSVSMLLQTVWW